MYEIDVKESKKVDNKGKLKKFKRFVKKVKKILKKGLKLIDKAAIVTLKCLCVVLGFAVAVAIFSIATLAGISIGLALSPIYTVKSLVEEYDECKQKHEHDKIVNQMKNYYKGKFKDTMSIDKEMQDFIASNSINLNELNEEIDNVHNIKLENVIQKGMEKDI